MKGIPDDRCENKVSRKINACDRDETTRGVLSTAPIVPAVAAYGLVLGAQATQKGLDFWEVPLMTGSNFAGGSEFAAINVWSSPPPLFLIMGITLLINSRHIIMSAALTPFIKHHPRWKAWLILFFISDESWAISYNDTKVREQKEALVPFSMRFYLGASILIYFVWVISTSIGAAIGPLLGDVDRFGFDMAFPAVFIFIIISMWTSFHTAKPWIVSLIVACMTHMFLPGSWYIVIGTLSGVTYAYIGGKP